MPELERWDSFYVIVGSAAGALIGLQFVVMTLVAQRPPSGPQAAAAFATPTIVHFGAALLLSALLRAPWDSGASVGAVLGVVGVCGICYGLVTAWRMHAQSSYRPDPEDWFFHAFLPLVAYTVLAISPLTARLSLRDSAFAVGAATLLLLFTGIHNAWDATTYHVMAMRRDADKPQ